MFTYCITGVVAAVGISESSIKQECPECKFVLSPKPAVDGDNGRQVIQTKEILWVAGQYEDSIQQPSPD